MSNVIKTIGDYELTEKDIDDFIGTLGQEQQMYRTMPEFRSQVLERLEEICLFAMLAQEQNVEEMEEYKDAIKAAKRDITGQLAMSNVLKDIEVTDEEAKEYFENNKASFAKGPSASAKHILVDNDERAKEIKASIEAGEITFEDAAKKHSSCPSGQKGGSLGTFGRGQMVKEFDNAVFEGELNKILGPVETQFGFHLIYVDNRTDGELPEFEEVSNKVKSIVIRDKQQKVYEEQLDTLRAKYVK
ncbi:MAG: peptidylprolyl isomerase [Lachnospiraceae bacterium]|nr:peptidylprolyl isomerase [Lachnospiraceae bacterium]